MANLFSGQFGAELDAARRRVRHTAHARRARMMVVVAGLSAVGLVGVATTLLAHLI